MEKANRHMGPQCRTTEIIQTIHIRRTTISYSTYVNELCDPHEWKSPTDTWAHNVGTFRSYRQVISDVPQ